MRHPRPSTIGSHLQQGDCIQSDGPTPPREQAYTILIISKNRGEGGWKGGEKPLNTSDTMLLLPATLVQKHYNPKHENLTHAQVYQNH